MPAYSVACHVPARVPAHVPGTYKANITRMVTLLVMAICLLQSRHYARLPLWVQQDSMTISGLSNDLPRLWEPSHSVGIYRCLIVVLCDGLWHGSFSTRAPLSPTRTSPSWRPLDPLPSPSAPHRRITSWEPHVAVPSRVPAARPHMLPSRALRRVRKHVASRQSCSMELGHGRESRSC